MLEWIRMVEFVGAGSKIGLIGGIGVAGKDGSDKSDDSDRFGQIGRGRTAAAFMAG